MEQNYHDFYRGEIYYAYLEPAFGHEQGGTRPVLILQNDVGNYFSPTLIVTAATTQRHRKKDLPTHVELSDVEGLPDISVFMLEVLRTIDKRRIRRYAGKLTKEQMAKIDEALRISLRLDEDAYLPSEVEAP
jgi:mRNA interferase MazF